MPQVEHRYRYINSKRLTTHILKRYVLCIIFHDNRRYGVHFAMLLPNGKDTGLDAVMIQLSRRLIYIQLSFLVFVTYLNFFAMLLSNGIDMGSDAVMIGLSRRLIYIHLIWPAPFKVRIFWIYKPEHDRNIIYMQQQEEASDKVDYKRCL